MAVLPFTNLNASADDAYFADGITEEIVGSPSAQMDPRYFGFSAATRTESTFACARIESASR